MNDLEVIKHTFKDQFKNIYKQFEDERELFFPEDNEVGIFPHFFFEENAVVQENWTSEVIEIRFNDEFLKELTNTHSDWNIDFLKDYIKEVANHEYGHTLTMESIFYLYPKDTRHILLNKNPSEITKKDLKRTYAESKCFYPNVKKVDLNFFEKIVFLDYWANLKVRYEIDSNPPEALLKERLDGSKAILPFSIINYPSKYLLELLLYSQLFFIHDKWELLVGIYDESNLDQLLFLYKTINSIFDKIIEISEDFDSMEELLFDLLEILERLNYKDIILKNRLNNQDKQSLRSFISRIRGNET